MPTNITNIAREVLRAAYRKVDKFLSVDVCPDPKVLYSFRSERDVKQWRVFTDSGLGGLSTAAFALSQETKQTAVFSGQYSKNVKEDSDLVRSGYCGIQQIRRWNIDLRPYDYLDFRVKGDGNTYLATLRLDQLTGGDQEVYQAPLPTSAGCWRDVRLDFRSYNFLYKGRVMASPHVQHLGAPRNKVLGMGITFSATDADPEEGAFCLEVESIIAGAYTLDKQAVLRKAFAGWMEFGPGELDERPPRQPPPITSHTCPRPTSMP